MTDTIDKIIKDVQEIPPYLFEAGSLRSLEAILLQKRVADSDYAVFLIDHYFQGQLDKLGCLPVYKQDWMHFVDTKIEPTTDDINILRDRLLGCDKESPFAVIGIGGGATMDVAKALSNLLTNKGNAEDYQGWDLVKIPGVFKVGIPTVSGTGAEASRTCVMINPRNGIKLGMNSEHTVFDQLILDPDLTRTVPSNQYFYSGMDSYIHCMEILNGSHRNLLADELSVQTMKLCREVFFDDDMKSSSNRRKLMMASFLGGLAVANSYVGVVHPFSAGLSVVLGVHHCMANCITMTAMEEFYPKEFEEFISMIERQKTDLPQGLCNNLNQNQYESLYQATIVHEKPLANALGSDFRNILTKEKVKELFLHM